MMLGIKPRTTLHVLSTHLTTPSSLVSFDQNSMLVVDFHHSFYHVELHTWCYSKFVVCFVLFLYVGSCAEIDMILNNPKVTTLLDHYDNEGDYIKFIQNMLFKSF